MLIYVDTNVWIYAYENDPVFGAAARQMLALARARQHQLAGSLLVLGELLVLPTFHGNQFALAMYRRLFESKQVELLSYTVRAMATYGELRAKRRLRPMDALHLATAVDAGVDVVVTEDRNLLAQTALGKTRVASIRATHASLSSDS